MDHAQALALYASFAGDRLTFLYSGSFHDEHTARLIALQEEFLEREGAPRALRGKLAFAMVEAYQNIVRHRVKDPALMNGAGRSLFLLRSSPEAHEVTAMNAVDAADEQKLRATLERLSGMDLHQMKQVFLRGLQDEARSHRGGAGLGLIEMARRSGNPLGHTFTPVGTGHALFTLQVLVGGSGVRRSEDASLRSVHRIVVENGITLLCRGDLPAVMQENLLRMIERDLDDDQARAGRAKHAFLLLMGAIEAMDIAGEGPMVAVAMQEGRTTVTVATPLTTKGAERAQQAVDMVNAMDPPALQRRYRDILLGRGEAASGLDLGLIDLARRSTGPLRSHGDTWRDAPFAVLEVDV
ncbi:MAG: SiaB family protein kinase [Flavobacteriales bacterium]|nr:SiaB family protein kinase [Flavobacteriales bacterium]